MNTSIDSINRGKAGARRRRTVSTNEQINNKDYVEMVDQGERDHTAQLNQSRYSHASKLLQQSRGSYVGSRVESQRMSHHGSVHDR